MTEQSASKPQIFMSYSRSEMYYAEALTSLLQEEGQNIWFDLQQLEPGCNWKENIGRGLEESDALILLASRIALASPYVEIEWQHALKNGRDIHILVFEELVFGDYYYTDSDGNKQTIDTRPLLKQAKTVIDGRGNFKKATKQFLQSLKGEELIIQKVPQPNRFNIPMNLPFAVNFVILVMLFLAAILFRVILAAFESNAIPIVIGFAFLLMLTGRELRNFLTRKSFGGTRNTLFFATVITAILGVLSIIFFGGDDAIVFSTAIPLSIIFFIAWWQSIFNLSLNRWAPRGEGIRRDVKGNRAFIRTNIVSELLRLYANLKWLYKIYALIGGYVLSFIIIVLIHPICALWLNLCTVGDLNFESIALFALVPIVLILFFDWLYHRRTQKIINKTDPASQSFRVIYNVADKKIAAQIDRIMRESGHRSKTVLKDEALATEELDFYVLVVTNYLQATDFESLLENSGRWIVVIASSLEKRDWHKQIQNFQWVDYRNHSHNQIKLIADELQQTEYDVVSTSLSSRTTPQSFSQTMLPFYVQAFIFIALVIVNVYTVLFSVGAWAVVALQNSSEEQMVRGILLTIILVLYVPIFIYTIRTVVDIMLREVSLGRVNNLAFVIFSVPILSRAFSGDINYIWAIVLFIVLNRVSYLWMTHWIPEKSTKEAREAARVGATTRRELYQNVLFVMFTLIALILSLIISQSNYTEIIGRALFIN